MCDDCWRHLPRLTPPLCRRCGAPLATSSLEAASCASGHPESGLTWRRAAGVYEGTLRAIIHTFKYQHRHSLSRPLATLMRSAGHELLSGADCVVPVPLHPTRRWSRGFNQAAALARHLGLPVQNLLRRTRPTPPQTTLTAAQRRTKRSRRIRAETLGCHKAVRAQHRGACHGPGGLHRHDRCDAGGMRPGPSERGGSRGARAHGRSCASSRLATSAATSSGERSPSTRNQLGSAAWRK